MTLIFFFDTSRVLISYSILVHITILAAIIIEFVTIF